MKTTMFTACLFIGGISASSDIKHDAKEILRVLQIQSNIMDQYLKCYITAYQSDSTIQDKRDCLGKLAKMSKPRNGRHSSLRHHPKLTINSSTAKGTRRQCRRFQRLGC